MRLRHLISAFALMLTAASSQANLISNGSFESGTSGWSVQNFASSTVVSSYNGISAEDGSYFAVLMSTKNTWAYLQTGFSAVAGQKYQLTFYAIETNATTPLILPVLYGVGYDVTEVDIAGASISGSAWTKETITFTWTGASSTSAVLYLGAAINYGDIASRGLLIDNVSLLAVPEPAEAVMMLAGLGLLGGMARSCRRKNTAHL